MVKLFDAHIPMTISSNGALLCYTTASAGWMTNTPRFSSPTVSALSYFSSAGLSHSKYAAKSMPASGAIYLDKPARLIRLLFGFVSDSVFQYLSSSIKIKQILRRKCCLNIPTVLDFVCKFRGCICDLMQINS